MRIAFGLLQLVLYLLARHFLLLAPIEAAPEDVKDGDDHHGDHHGGEEARSGFLHGARQAVHIIAHRVFDRGDLIPDKEADDKADHEHLGDAFREFNECGR